MLTFAIIGAGAGVFRHHLAALKSIRGTIVALADSNPTAGVSRAQELGCPFYQDYRQMVTDMQPDVAVILTPPFLHASMTIDCLRAGCHVLVEKPMALHVAEADQMIEVAHQTRRLLGVVFQHRFRPEIRIARSVLEAGTLGSIQHVALRAFWPRPSAYYQSASWRATWAGEGGGVIMNQAPHDLDLLCYLLGVPGRVVAWTSRALHHDIETEDTVQAMLAWSNNATGSLYASTAGAAEGSLDIIGTAGSLHLGKTVTLTRFSEDMRQFVTAPPHPFPSHTSSVLAERVGKATHLDVYRPFCDVLLGQRNTRHVDGTEARKSLELANALNLSGQLGTEIVLPLNAQAYARTLAEWQAPRTTDALPVVERKVLRAL